MKNKKYSNIPDLIKEAKKGKMFILVDDENRENEGDLIIPSSKVTAKAINFMAKYGRGLICLTLSQRQTDKLNLSLMSPNNISRSPTAFTVSIDAKYGITTGISALDRFKTIKLAIKKKVSPKYFVSPGHVFPIVAKNGGVLVRAGHTEASVDLSKFAGCSSSAVICEIMNDDGTMAQGKQILNFAKKHKLKVGKIDDLISYRLARENFTKLKKTSSIKIDRQIYSIKIFENLLDHSENFALIKGNISPFITPRVRVISSNIVKNYLIGEKLPNSFNKTISYFKKYKDCVLIFIRDTNLRSVSDTLRAYKSKNFYKNGESKLIKNYGIGAQIIKQLGIQNMILVTSSKKKVVGLDGYGIKITKQEILK
jgi:3,4-dihydroxy 2-butanone 4-phosphate synthase / GTP cyclohydrolase II